MAWGSGAIAALARGFWNRLQGLLADDRAGVAAVQRLANTAPTFVPLDIAESTQLYQAGRQAQLAAQQWQAGNPLESLDIPKIPQPSWPSMESDEPGHINIGLLLGSPERVGNDVPVFLSTAKLKTFQETIQALDEFIWENCRDVAKISESDCWEALRIQGDIQAGRGGWIIGWQLWERLFDDDQ